MNEASSDARPPEKRPAAPPSPPRGSRFAFLAGILAMAATFAVVFYVARLGQKPVDLELAPARIAVMPFAGTPRPADSWLGWGLSTIVTETLAQTSGIEVLPPDRLRQLLSQRGIEFGAADSQEKARRLALAAGAGLIVEGDFDRREDGTYTLRFDLIGPDLQKVGGGQLAAADPLILAGQLVESLTGGMAPTIEGNSLKVIFGPDAYLTRLYGEGIQQLASGTTPNARATVAKPYFEILLRSDPSFTRGKARLVDCLRELGELGPARKMAEQLLQETLPRGESDLQVSTFRALGLIEAVEGDETAAAEQFRLGHRAALASQDRSGELALLGELVRLALAKSDRNKAEELLVEMVQVQKALGDRLGEADSLLQIGSLYLSAGDLDGAGKVLEESRVLVAAAGDSWGEQRIAASLGEIAWRRGEHAIAADHWTQALEFYRKQNDRQRILMMTRNLGEAQIRAGRFAEAEKLVLDQRELAAELGNETTKIEACVSQAWLQLRLGFPFQAREPLDCALTRDTLLGDRKRLRQVIAWLAYEQGDYPLATAGMQDLRDELQKQNPPAWTSEDEAFLQVFIAAQKEGKRLDLPGETGYRAP